MYPPLCSCSFVRLSYVIADLLSDPENMVTSLYTKPYPSSIHETLEDDYVISSVHTARWYKRTYDSINQSTQEGDSPLYVLGIKMFADSTAADISRSKHKYKPIMATIENFNQRIVNKVCSLVVATSLFTSCV